jgi:hypothetical protein
MTAARVWKHMQDGFECGNREAAGAMATHLPTSNGRACWLHAFKCGVTVSSCPGKLPSDRLCEVSDPVLCSVLSCPTRLLLSSPPDIKLGSHLCCFFLS